jgi:uncharacterized protein (TIGR04141 family)
MDDPIGLTIYLLKQEQIATFEQHLFVSGQTQIPLANGFDGVFLPMPANPRQPPWVSAVQQLLQASQNLSLQSQSPAGLLVVRRASKTFVLSFGHAWQKLQDEWLERDFGRRVALNSIARSGLLEIRAEQVFAKWHLSNERAPRASSVDEFGVQFDRDLVASVEGIPSDALLGKTIRGGTSLRLQLPISELAMVLDKSGPLFASNQYKKVWPEVDNLTPVRDSSLILQLESVLDQQIVDGSARKNIVLFTPSQRRDEDVDIDSYVFGRWTKSPPVTPYLTYDTWLSFLDRNNELPSLVAAKQSHVHLLNELREPAKRVTAFQCFCSELSLNGAQYVLSSGLWYQASKDFVARINRIISQIPDSSVGLPRWSGTESEGDFNRRCATDPSFLNFDAKSVAFGGGRSKLEFCDLLHPASRTLFFVKIASKSTGMSHLVEQVRRTAEALFSADDSFRLKLKGNVDEIPSRREYRLARLTTQSRRLEAVSCVTRAAGKGPALFREVRAGQDVQGPARDGPRDLLYRRLELYMNELPAETASSERWALATCGERSVDALEGGMSRASRQDRSEHAAERGRLARRGSQRPVHTHCRQ